MLCPSCLTEPSDERPLDGPPRAAFEPLRDGVHGVRGWRGLTQGARCRCGRLCLTLWELGGVGIRAPSWTYRFAGDGGECWVRASEGGTGTVELIRAWRGPEASPLGKTWEEGLAWAAEQELAAEVLET